MESNQFDALAKGLARARSRRAVIKGIGAVALGAMGLSRLNDAAAAPACRKEGHPCEGNQTCCDGLACFASGPGSALRCAPCLDGTTLVDGSCVAQSSCDDGIQNGDETDVDCGGSCAPCIDGLQCGSNTDCQSQTCVSGVCTSAASCTDGEKNGNETDIDCGGSCDPCADDKQCVKDSDCSSGHCIAGVCKPCSSGQTFCGSACVDTTNDFNNCGGCGQVCSGANATMTCLNSACAIASCNPGFADCDGVVSGGCETDLSTVTNCGGCGNICPGYQQPNDNVTCQNGTCTFSCQGEYYDVDGDPSNGCEVQANPTDSHTQGAASSLGSLSSCSDGGTVTGTLPSDTRVHANPAIIGFDGSKGSAPVWYVVKADGGSCNTDLGATLTISNSANPSCYHLLVQAGINTFTAQTNGSGIATITQGSGAYHDGDDVFFQISKTCGTNVTEAANFSLSFHL